MLRNRREEVLRTRDGNARRGAARMAVLYIVIDQADVQLPGYQMIVTKERLCQDIGAWRTVFCKHHGFFGNQ